MMPSTPDLIVLHEHPEWQKPLFAALTRRGVAFEPFDLTRAAFTNVEALRAPVYFNQASPSAYLRGNTRAVPLALAYMRSLERLGARVLNGADVFALELSKSAQATLLRTLGIDCPRSITFNDVARAAGLRVGDPLAGAPQAGPGRQRRAHSGRRVAGRGRGDLRSATPPSGCPTISSCCRSICRTIPSAASSASNCSAASCSTRCASKTHGRFNLCPSPVCNPDEGAGACELPQEPAAAAPPVEFYPFPEVPDDAVETARRIVRAAGLDVGGIEYLETFDGRRVFYDINANSNLRPSVAAAFGFDPFERVVDFLAAQLARR